ncbi:MAG: M16 family metallopeptidase [Candidatus Eiseniibacteriota bacterium]
MRTLRLVGLLLLLAVPGSAGVFPYKYEVQTLDNGLKAILIPMPGSGLVSYYSVVRTGSRDEVEPGHTGFAHFFEHMMFRGTEKYPADVRERIVTGMGANTNAYTTDDYTCYYMNVASEDLPQVVELEADRFQNLSYAEPVFQTESGAVYGEYRKNRTQPFSVLFEALQDKAFDVHTYKHTTMGFEKDIAAMPTMYEYSKSFFARFYRPENVVLVVTGDFDAKAVAALIGKHYGGWKAGYQAPAVQAEPEQTGERTLEVAYDGRTLPMVTIAWKGPAFDPSNREVAAGALLGELLFGETSAAYRELVLEKRIAQRVFAGFRFSRDPGLWTVSAQVAGEPNIAAVREALDQAVARIQESPPAAKDLDDLKRRSRYGFLMGMDTPDRVAGGLARFIAMSGGIESVEALYAAMVQVTPEDVQAVARTYLTRDRRTVAVLKGVQS